MFSLSPIKILVVVAVILLLLGPDKLPDVANKLGRGWRALRRLQERVEAEVRSAVPDLPSSAEIARIARSPVNLLNQLADRAEAADPPAAADEWPGPDADPTPPSTPEPPAPDSAPAATGLSAPAPRAAPPPAAEPPPADPALN